MNIIIDTSILAQDRGFLGSDFLFIKQLSKLGFLKIHIPWVVYKEITSQNIRESEKALQDARKKILSLGKKGLSEEDYCELKEIADTLEKKKGALESSIEKNWNDFITESKAILYDINDEDGRLVMSAYFLGDKPFPAPKSRKDIPDAFIYESIKSIKKKIGKIHFICADNNLRKAVNELDDCIGFESYSEFYKSDEYIKIKEEYDKKYSPKIFISNSEEKILEFAKKEVNNIFDDSNIGASILSEYDITGEMHNMEEISIDEEASIDKVHFIDGVFYISTSISGIFGIEYLIDKYDYYMQKKYRKISIIDREWNEYYYLVYEEFDVKLSYQCSIEEESLKNKKINFKREHITIKEINIRKTK